MAERKHDQSLPALVGELRELVVAYVLQETIDPLKALGRYTAFGVAGSVLLAVGLSFWLVAGLRALQSETGSTFTGHLAWIPYAVCMGGAVVLIALTVVAIGRGRRSRRSKTGGN